MLTFLSVCYASLRTTSASQLGKLGMGDEAAAENAALLTSDDLNTSDDGGESGGRKTVDNERDAVLYNWCMFHLTFMFASLCKDLDTPVSTRRSLGTVSPPSLALAGARGRSGAAFRASFAPFIYVHPCSVYPPPPTRTTH